MNNVCIQFDVDDISKMYYINSLNKTLLFYLLINLVDIKIIFVFIYKDDNKYIILC